ncbi:MAG: hypothetical protein HYV09_19360 [Deltaproteobacteria bacterium]|nr:hypothetical protein [Deltaproteobacteria bacterium]
MRLRATIPGLLLIAIPSVAWAWPQRRDYFLDPPRPGTFVHADAFTVGVQGSIEKRVALEDESLGMFHVRASALASLGYADVAAHTDLRFAGLLTIGASAGYRRVWQNFSWDPGKTENTREVRNDKLDDDANPRGPKVASWPWYEARARLVIPLESLWFVGNAALRWESPGSDGLQDPSGMPQNAFDWFHTNVHGPGRMTRLDATLFFRHQSFGAVGPTIRYMDLPRHDGREREVVYGLTFGTRPGFSRKDDLFLVQTLFDFRDREKSFGWHVSVLHEIPAFIMVIYRRSFEL